MAIDTSGNLESTDEKTIEFEISMPEPEQPEPEPEQSEPEPEQPDEPELEPSPQLKRSTSSVFWVIYLLIILIIMIIMAVVVYSYYKIKKGSKQESSTTETITIEPIPSPTLENIQEKISTITAVPQLQVTPLADGDKSSTTSNSITPKLPGKIPTHPGIIPQQMPQVEQKLQLPPVQNEEVSQIQQQQNSK